jgi:preprotein translocase SecE subunit
VSQTQVEKRPFFAIYKPGQGKWLRWGTVAGATLVAGLGAGWLGYYEPHLATAGEYALVWRVLAATLWLLLWAWLTFWFVNNPKWAEFLIMTESEMRKVAWPSRRDVINATKVVILLTFGLGGILWIVDVGFLGLFKWIGIM